MEATTFQHLLSFHKAQIEAHLLSCFHHIPHPIILHFHLITTIMCNAILYCADHMHCLLNKNTQSNQIAHIKKELKKLKQKLSNQQN